MQSAEQFQTARLTATRVADTDLTELLSMWQDPLVMATLGGVRDEAACREQLRLALEHWDTYGFGLWVLREASSGRFAGHANLRHWLLDSLPELDLGYALLPPFWGSGLGTEIARAVVELAFSRLGCEHLTAMALHDNTPSRRIIEKLGFEFDRDIVYRDLPHALYRLRRPRPQAS